MDVPDIPSHSEQRNRKYGRWSAALFHPNDSKVCHTGRFMNEHDIHFSPIGVIRSEHTVAKQTPIQPTYAKGCRGRIELLPQYVQGLQDLAGFSHLYLITHLHQADPGKMIVKPFLQDVERGVFSTRAPCRPNAIGLSIVELIAIEGSVLHLDGVDILDGTPLLDIKPYCAKFDRIDHTRNGWQDEVDEATAQQLGVRDYTPSR
jgi:tRNA-Thr(GGU) m(6)t(6)A37 methyltransferase TsaA